MSQFWQPIAALLLFAPILAYELAYFEFKKVCYGFIRAGNTIRPLHRLWPLPVNRPQGAVNMQLSAQGYLRPQVNNIIAKDTEQQISRVCPGWLWP